MKVVEFTEGGVSPFGRWFSELNAPAAAKVASAFYRLEQGRVVAEGTPHKMLASMASA